MWVRRSCYHAECRVSLCALLASRGAFRERRLVSRISLRGPRKERLLERERVKAGVAMSSQRKAQECGELESTIREPRCTPCVPCAAPPPGRT